MNTGSRRPWIVDDRRNATETYLTTEQLTSRTHCYPRTNRTRLKGVIFLKGVLYIRSFGSRMLLFIPEPILRDIVIASYMPTCGMTKANCGVALWRGPDSVSAQDRARVSFA